MDPQNNGMAPTTPEAPAGTLLPPIEIAYFGGDPAEDSKAINGAVGIDDVEVKPIVEGTPPTLIQEEKDWKVEYEKLFQQHTGLQGVLNESNERVRKTEAELFKARAAEIALAQQRQQQSELEEDQKIETLLKQPPDQIVAMIRQRYEDSKREKIVSKALTPKIQEETRQTLQQQEEEQVRTPFRQGILEAAKKLGLNDDELMNVAKTSNGNWVQFADDFVSAGVKKKMDSEFSKLQQSLKAEVIAELRGNRPSPVVSTGSTGPTTSSLGDIAKAFNEGRISVERYRDLTKSHR